MRNAQGTLIGVDLGTATGTAMLTFGIKPAVMKLRRLDLSDPKELRRLRKERGKDALRFHDPRVLSLWLQLNDMVDHVPEPVWLAFEDVRFAKSLAQVQLWSSLRGALWTLPVHPSRYFSVTTSTLKSYAGGSSKERMQANLKRRLALTDSREYDDNIVDAAWVLTWALDTQFGISIESLL